MNDKKLDRLKKRLEALEVMCDQVDITDPKTSQRQLDLYNKNLKECEKLEKEIERLSMSDEDKAAKYKELAEAKLALSGDLEHILISNNIFFVSKGGIWFLQDSSGSWIAHKQEHIRTKFRDLQDAELWRMFLEVRDNLGRNKTTATYSWKKPAEDVLNLMDTDCLCPMGDSGDYHWFFDVLFCSLGGGKDENIEHLQQVIYSKWLHPDNPMLPALVVGAKNGGVGKGLFTSHMASALFGDRLVAGNASMRHITGNFNSMLEGKAFICINESVSDKVDKDGLNAVLQSPFIEIEKKGFDPITSENTALYMITGNDILGSVKLSGNNVDRRYSIIKTTKQLEDWLIELKPEMFSDRGSAARWIKKTGEKIIGDKAEVGKWLKAMFDRYGDLDYVSCLHGEDYKEILGLQQQIYIDILEKIFCSGEYEYIRRPLIYELYALEQSSTPNGKSFTMGKKRFYKEVEDFIETRDLSIELRIGVNIKKGNKITTADVYVIGEHDNTRFIDNDDEFIVVNDDGRKISKLNLHD